jgi:hypothetical protein
MKLLPSLLDFILFTSKKYNIDESHGLGHSMDVLINSHNIYNSELLLNPSLNNQQHIIYTAASLHDMCDRKYILPSDGILNIEFFLNDKLSKSDIDIIKQIITTMSYSKVKINGFPELGEYQLAYHIVREADLLAAYNVDRCLLYNMYHIGDNIITAYNDTKKLFENRMFKHFEDELFITDFSKKRAKELEIESYKRLDHWAKIIQHL